MELTIEQALQQGVAAHNSGNLQEAERAYQAILQSQPKHPDANHNLGLIAISVNQIEAALPLFKTALDVNPNVEQFWISYIDALVKAKHLKDAKQAIKKAKKKGFDATKLQALFSQSKANADTKVPSQQQLSSLLEYYQIGQYGDAEKLAKSITQEFPKHQFGWKVLGSLLKQTGRINESLAPSKKSVQLSPQDAEAHFNLGNVLKELVRFDEALVSYKQAIALTPDFAEAHYNLGNALLEIGRLDEAEASYTQVIALKPEDFKTHTQLLMCLFQQDKKSVFFDKLDYLINQDKASALVGSLTCRAALKYGLEKPNLFCTKPLSYVLHNDLNTQYDFEKIFVEKAKSILNENRILNRKQSLLVNGNQTLGNIFDIKNDETNEIQNIIRIEVEKYRTKFKESEEGLIKKMPAEYSLYGWLISMKSGGNLKPHIHTKGWLSGSIYINVPQKLKVDSGNLVVCLGEENDAIDTRINEKKTINVVTGSMVLFPSSLTHYTIPFESEEERIVLAFDVKE